MTFSFTKSLTGIFLILLYSTSNPTVGQSYITNQDGHWASANTWKIQMGCSENPSGPVPPFEKSWGCAVDIKIQHQVTYSGHIVNFGNGLINGLELSPGASLTVNGDFALPASGWGSVTYLKLGEGATLNVSGTLTLGKTAEIVIPKNTTITVGNLIVDDNSPIITIEEGAELIVLNQTTIKANRTLNVKGNFTSKTLVNNSGKITSSGKGTTLIEEDIFLNGNSSLVFSGNSQIVSGRNMITSGAGSMVFTGHSAISFAGNMNLSQGSNYKFADNSNMNVGGSLNTTGGALITFDGMAQGKVGEDISLGQGAIINLNQNTFFSSGGNVTLNDGAKINISGKSQGFIKGNVDMRNGEINTSGSSTLFVDGKLTAYRDGQVKAINESGIYICDYLNSTPKESKFINMQPSSFYGLGCGKLPVDWMGVDVVGHETGKNIISWATAKEWENSHFEIERSNNGIDNFEKIGEVHGIGWSSSVTSYSYEDRSLYKLSGSLYYRIKQVDFNGNIDYSKVVALKLPKTQASYGEWKAYPNPSTGSNLKVLMTNFDLSSKEHVNMRMISSSFQSDTVMAKYGKDLDLEISRAFEKAPRGIVVIELVWEDKVTHLKVLKN